MMDGGKETIKVTLTEDGKTITIQEPYMLIYGKLKPGGMEVRSIGCGNVEDHTFLVSAALDQLANELAHETDTDVNRLATAALVLKTLKADGVISSPLVFMEEGV